MKIKDLTKLLEEEKIADIEIEDNEGNTIIKLSELQMADMKNQGENVIVKLQEIPKEIKKEQTIKDELTIEIHASSDGEGYFYEIYNTIDEDGEELDGGLCTGSMKDALGMAIEQAKNLIKHNH